MQALDCEDGDSRICRSANMRASKLRHRHRHGYEQRDRHKCIPVSLFLIEMQKQCEGTMQGVHLSSLDTRLCTNTMAVAASKGLETFILCIFHTDAFTAMKHTYDACTIPMYIMI